MILNSIGLNTIKYCVPRIWLEDIRKDSFALEKETEGLMGEVLDD